jgi:predicted nuclease of restriction endonuclease-like (RecB) superfamily
MSKIQVQSKNIEQIYQRIKEVLTNARSRAWQAINTSMVASYWEIGRIIIEEEQKGKARAEYGEYILANLAKKLTKDFGKGFDESNLRYIRKFYMVFPIRDAVRHELSWTHYRLLLKVEKPNARSFYETECINSRWSTRELERQISSLLFERLALSRDKKGVMELANKGHEIQKPEDLVKDPYILEFAGIRQDDRFQERELEQALIDKLQHFLLELGKGFSFVARQHRITLDGDHFYIDLVFYNRLTRSFILIDLKVGKLTHQDIGQMQMYLNYYRMTQMIEGENEPIGIVLCAEKNEAVVKYTLPEGKKRIFASRYKLYLPTEKELATELIKERQAIEMERKLQGE